MAEHMVTARLVRASGGGRPLWPPEQETTMTKRPAKKPKTASSTAPRHRAKRISKTPPQSNNSKSEIIRKLLGRPGGASIDELSEATGWQAHSVRGFLSGTMKKKLGLTLVTSKDNGRRRYRLEGRSADS
jgi:hypothetical protein